MSDGTSFSLSLLLLAATASGCGESDSSVFENSSNDGFHG